MGYSDNLGAVLGFFLLLMYMYTDSQSERPPDRSWENFQRVMKSDATLISEVEERLLSQIDQLKIRIEKLELDNCFNIHVLRRTVFSESHPIRDDDGYQQCLVDIKK